MGQNHLLMCKGADAGSNPQTYGRKRRIFVDDVIFEHAKLRKIKTRRSFCRFFLSGDRHGQYLPLGFRARKCLALSTEVGLVASKNGGYKRPRLS